MALIKGGWLLLNRRENPVLKRCLEGEKGARKKSTSFSLISFVAGQVLSFSDEKE